MTPKPLWTIRFSEEAEKSLSRLDPPIQKRLYRFLTERVCSLEDPRLLGGPLSHRLKGLWRYKVAKDYRILCEIQEEELVILALEVGHRRAIYKKHQ